MSTIEHIPLDQICGSPYQPRKIYWTDAVTTLASSIKASGQLEPVVVVYLPEEEMYRLVSGHRRVEALRRLKESVAQAIVVDMTEEEQRQAALEYNLEREDLHPLDEAVAVTSAMLGDGEHCISAKEMANRLGKTVKWVEMRNAVTTGVVPEWVELLEKKSTPVWPMEDLARLASLPSGAQLLALDVAKVVTPHRLSRRWFDSVLKDRMLSEAQWDLDEEHPVLGACTGCQYNTASAQSSGTLFDDIREEPACTYLECWKQKLTESAQKRLRENRDHAIVTSCDPLLDDQFEKERRYQPYSKPSESDEVTRALDLSSGRLVRVRAPKKAPRKPQAPAGERAFQRRLKALKDGRLPWLLKTQPRQPETMMNLVLSFGMPQWSPDRNFRKCDNSDSALEVSRNRAWIALLRHALGQAKDVEEVSQVCSEAGIDVPKAAIRAANDSVKGHEEFTL